MKHKLKMAAIISAGFLTGCAGYTAKPLTLGDQKQDDRSDGIRYYEVAPYLLVYSDGKGNLTSKIEWLPDLSRKMTLDLYAWAANNNTELTFTNGVLTNSTFALDTTAIPNAVLDTIQTLGSAAIAGAFNAPPDAGTTREIPAPYLFKIVVDEDGTRLVGGQGTGPDGEPLVVKVSVTKDAAAAASATSEEGSR